MCRRISRFANYGHSRWQSLRNRNAATLLTGVADSPMLASVARGKMSATFSRPVVQGWRLNVGVGSTRGLPRPSHRSLTPRPDLGDDPEVSTPFRELLLEEPYHRILVGTVAVVADLGEPGLHVSDFFAQPAWVAGRNQRVMSGFHRRLFSALRLRAETTDRA